MDPDRLRAAAPLVAAIVGALALAVGARMWFAGAPPEDPPGPVPAEVAVPATAAEPALTVHVSGWVTSPGLVTLRSGARVADAVAAAGGARPGARLDVVNLAEPVSDGSRVTVPGPGDDVRSVPDQAGAGGGGSGRVNVNRASLEELQTLPGVGPVLAERIVSHRDSHGPFQVVEDLLDVPGIGEGRLADLRDRIDVP